MYLIPEPQKIVWESGTFCMDYRCKILAANSLGESAMQHAFLLQQELEKQLGYRLQITRGEKQPGCIRLERAGTELTDAAWNREGGYTLAIGEDGITITGAGDSGILYGIQTLRQIVTQAGAVLPCLVTEDFPYIPNRGFYHDVTRGRIPKLSYLKQMADRMAYYKMNQLQLYIEHSFLFPRFSEMWRDDTPITPQEILELDAYCRKLHIELVPSISSFGHLYKLLQTRTFSHLCELDGWQDREFSFFDRMQHHTIDVSNPESLALVKEMIAEFMPLFTSKQFNICGDETFDLGKGKSRPLADKVGVKTMYVNFVKELCEFLVENGKRPMFWGDVICGFPEAIRELPEETVCLNWGYAPFQNEDGSRSLYEAGAIQYSCPGVGGWNQFVNLTESSYENITRMTAYARKYGAIGVLNTDWGDFGHINHPDFSIPGLIYGAAFSWNPENIPLEEINRRISRIEYQDQSERFVSVMTSVAECTSFGWDAAVRYAEGKKANVSEEELKKIYREHTKGSAAEKNENLNRILQTFYSIIPSLAAEKRTQIKPFAVAVEGMLLFNRIGDVVEGREVSVRAADADEDMRLAEELEHWLYHYKEVWRTVSRESELYRIQNMVIWYADYLREIR